MSADASPKPSFSRGRRWSIGLNVGLSIVALLAVTVMVNYLSGQYYRRLFLGSQSRVELSSPTKSLLRSLTNKVQVILYYDKNDDYFGDVSEILKAYSSATPNLSVRLVDYLRYPGAAQEIKAKYPFAAASDKNLVIFDCEGRSKFVPGDSLMETILKPLPGSPGEKPKFYRKRIAFMGEMAFTGALLAVINPKPPQAYVLQGHGEHAVADGTDPMGYLKFASVLQTNYIKVDPLSLITNPVPADCNLLIIAGPKDPMLPVELGRIEQYLNEGGRVFVMFNHLSAGRETGLEKILAKWGVEVSGSIVKDPDYTTTASGLDVIVGDFRKCPAVNPLVGSQMQLILPREINKLPLPAQAVEALKVEPIAYSGPRSFLQDGSANPARGPLPLMVAVEKGVVKGVIPERGSTRMLVVGDSIFLSNRQIESGANSDFAGYAVNWLLERAFFLEGTARKPVVEYRLLIPRKQMRTVQWILLGALPGGVLLLGGLVWLRRRR